MSIEVRAAATILSQIRGARGITSIAISEKQANTAVIALEKRIPRFPKRTSIDESTDFNCHCPDCGYKFISNIGGEYVAGTFSRYCPNCGQAMRWS